MQVRWVPECLDHDVAARVASRIREAAGSDDPFFGASGQRLLQAGLLAAAIGGHTTGEVAGWLRSGELDEMMPILRGHPDLVPEVWIEHVQAVCSLPEELREGCFATARGLLDRLDA